MNKDVIAKKVREQVSIFFPDLDPNYGSCLHHSLLGMFVLKTMGIEAQIQAGSISWPIINMEDDDGVRNTHFSMMWEPGHPNSVMSMATGGIPEIHTWLGIPESNTLIDFATYQLKTIAGPMLKPYGDTWETDDPPDYLWIEGGALPPNVQYTPDIGAMKYVHSILPDLWESRARRESDGEADKG